MTIRPDPTPLAASCSPQTADGRAALLLQLIQGLGVPYGCERSFRLCPGTLLPHRFLLSLATEALPGRPHRSMLEIARRLHMPEPLLVEMERSIGAARFVHFGFEEGTTTSLFKVYLEVGARCEASQPVSDETSPVLLHLGFKWAPFPEQKGIVTNYVWYPSLSVRGIAARLSRLYDARGGEEARRLALRVLEAAAGRAGREGVRYLEVTEDGTERRSFDLNCYDAGMTLEDVSPVLQDMGRHFGIAVHHLASLYDGIKRCTLGHVAGGVHRQGEAFFNLYYGPEGRHG